MASLNTAYTPSILSNVTPSSTFTPNLTQPNVVSTSGNTAQFESISGPPRLGGGSRRKKRTNKRRCLRHRKTYRLKRHSRRRRH